MAGGERSTNEPTAADIEALIREFDASDALDLHVRTDSFEIVLSKHPDGRIVTHHHRDRAERAADAGRPARRGATAALPPDAAGAPRPPAASTKPALAEPPEGCFAVRAPYKGTFYRAPKPGEPAFVEIGSAVKAGADLCLVEVMKLFTAVRTERPGVVRQIYAVDGQLVDDSELLFAIEPEG